MELISKKFAAAIVSSVVITGGAVFAGTKYLNEQQINVLKEQIELQKLQNHHEGTGVELPSGVKMDASKDPESQELIERVELLERERAELLKQLSSNVVSSLDPASEVSTLLKKVSSDKDNSEAVATLFEIKSPISFEPLAEYYLNNHNSYGHLAGKTPRAWFSFFVSVDLESGLKLVISMLDTPNFPIGDAYYFLKHYITSTQVCELVTEDLQKVALTSPNPTARGNAKLLLECSDLAKPEPLQDQSETIFVYDSDEIKSFHRIFSLFKESGIEDDFHSMVASSNSVSYWATGSFLYREALLDQNGSVYMSTLESLATLEMAKSSKGFILLLLSQLYEANQRLDDAKQALESCHSIAPKVCASLSGTQI